MLGFLIAAAAGYLTPQITESLADPVIKAVSRHITIKPAERPVVGFLIAMLAAGVAADLLHSGSPFWVIAGGALGYFGTRLANRIQKLINRAPDDR
ncbi:hypothetical protein [Yoonia sp.]|uniref:hypothetical protein n=1 Tax=Yoonia sp. TaxID=2212373 RepID=UPI003F6D7E70